MLATGLQRVMSKPLAAAVSCGQATSSGLPTCPGNHLNFLKRTDQAAGSPSGGTLPSCWGTPKPHTRVPDGCQWSAEVSGATKTYSRRKCALLYFSCPLCTPFIFISHCLESDLLISPFGLSLWKAALLSSTEGKPRCTIHKQKGVGQDLDGAYYELGNSPFQHRWSLSNE